MIAVDLARFKERVDAMHRIYERRKLIGNGKREWVASVLGEHPNYEGDGSEHLMRLKQLIDNDAALTAITKRLTA